MIEQATKNPPKRVHARALSMAFSSHSRPSDLSLSHRASSRRTLRALVGGTCPSGDAGRPRLAGGLGPVISQNPMDIHITGLFGQARKADRLFCAGTENGLHTARGDALKLAAIGEGFVNPGARRNEFGQQMHKMLQMRASRPWGCARLQVLGNDHVGPGLGCSTRLASASLRFVIPAPPEGLGCGLDGFDFVFRPITHFVFVLDFVGVFIRLPSDHVFVALGILTMGLVDNLASRPFVFGICLLCQVDDGAALSFNVTQLVGCVVDCHVDLLGFLDRTAPSMHINVVRFNQPVNDYFVTLLNNTQMRGTHEACS